MTDPRRRAVLFVAVCLLTWAVVAASGVPPILSVQHDEETAESSFAGANDLSAEVQPVRLVPRTVTANGTDSVTVELPVRAAEDVNTAEFTLAIASDGRAVPVPAANVTCDRNCTLTVHEGTVAGLVDGTGEYELIVTGWWTYDRQFVATANVTVVPGSPSTERPTSTHTGTPTNTATENRTQTATPTPNTTGSSAPTTATPRPTNSSTNSSTPTPTATPTPTPTATPTPTPTATPTNSSTPTPSPTATSTPTDSTTAEPSQ